MKISIVLVAATGSFETDMNRASKTAQKRMKEIEASAKKFGAALGTAIAAGATAAAVAIKAAIDRADELSKTAQKIGVTTESLSTLSYAAQLADVELGELQGGLIRLTKAQGEAAAGNKDLIALFDALGVSFQNADGTLRNSDETFRDVADALERIPDGATKTKTAIELLGRSGANLIPLTKGLEEAEQRARDLGLELSTEAGKSAEEFNDRLEDVKLMALGLATAVGVELLPDLNRLVGTFQDGAEKGANFESTAENIANGIRGVAWVAGKAYDTVNLLAMGIANITAEIANFWATYTPMGRLLTTDADRLALGNAAAVTGARAGEAARSLTGTQEPGLAPIPGQGKGRAGRAAATRDDATEAIRSAEAEKALAEANGAGARAAAEAAAAKAANSAASRAAADAAKDAEKAARDEAEAAKKVAEQAFDEQMDRIKLAAEEKQQREEELQAGKDVRDGLLFELELMKMTNAEQAEAIMLRGLSAEAIAAYGDEIRQLNADIEANIKVAEGMDVVRDSTQGLFEDLMSGSKSASDAFKDFVANILDGIAQIVARNLTEQLLGSFGSTGGGASGGGLASLFGAFFGGARASGGPVYPGKAFLVGEEGPELFIPPAAGNIANAGATRGMLGGRGTTNVTFVLPGRNDLRSEQQRQADLARVTGRQLARGTA